MGGEEIARTGSLQRHLEGLAALIHEVARALDRRQRGVALIEMADLRPKAPPSTAPPADAESEFLAQAHFRAIPVELAVMPR